MTRTVEFLFDFGSPTTYLAHKRIPAVTARSGIVFDYVPILLGGVFKATGNASPVTVLAKGRYMNADMGRFAAKFGVPLAMNPFFPINTISLMRGATGYRGTPRYAAYIDAVFDAMWQTPVNMGDPEIVAGVLAKAGFDAAEFAALIGDAAVKDALKSNTEAAVARGVFGAPTFFVGDAMFFGQDRLDWVEEAALA
ncbi:MAG: 2-hydroxychromene-2-carboxylate isomerase [Polymorphobacter sp.]